MVVVLSEDIARSSMVGGIAWKNESRHRNCGGFPGTGWGYSES